MALNVGTQVGSFEITALIGKGGMGEVYRARDLKLKRDVAIKMLPQELSRDAERVHRLQREAEVLAWVAQGKSNSEVAGIIQARPRTIEKHLEHVYKKLGVENRFAAMLAVIGQGIAQLTL